jgi:hypothetical protein
MAVPNRPRRGLNRDGGGERPGCARASRRGRRTQLALAQPDHARVGGFESLDEIRHNEAGYRSPVFVITAVDLSAADHERLNGPAQRPFENAFAGSRIRDSRWLCGPKQLVAGSKIAKKTRRYLTDLTDEEWSQVEPLLPPGQQVGEAPVDAVDVVGGDPHRRSGRLVVAAIAGPRHGLPPGTLAPVGGQCADDIEGLPLAASDVKVCRSWQRSIHAC